MNEQTSVGHFFDMVMWDKPPTSTAPHALTEAEAYAMVAVGVGLWAKVMDRNNPAAGWVRVRSADELEAVLRHNDFCWSGGKATYYL